MNCQAESESRPAGIRLPGGGRRDGGADALAGLGRDAARAGRSGWPQSLKTAVRIMLDSRYAMWLGWGPELTFFYNDAYARMTLGPKHPWALGRSAREVWSEIWDDIGPRAESVIRTGQATWDEGLLLFLERRRLPGGDVSHLLVQPPARRPGRRRGDALRGHGGHASGPSASGGCGRSGNWPHAPPMEAKSAEEACRTAARTLAENPHDLPFVLVYLLDDEGAARLAGATGLPEGSPAAPAMIDLSGAGGRVAGWPLPAVRRIGAGRDRHGPGGSVRAAAVRAVARAGTASRRRPDGEARPGTAGRIRRGGGQPPADPRRRLQGIPRPAWPARSPPSIANAQAYEEERRRAEALAELDRAKTAFFSNVSHEFRTPLTLMLGPAEDALADEDGPLLPRQRERVEILHRNALRLLKLVNTLLDFSRIEAGRVQAVYEPTDLAALTADLASVFRSAVERAGMELVVDCPPLPEPAYVDRDMWEKIVLNLVSNAFKFTMEGRITVTLRLEGDAIRLRVADTGAGIPADELPQIVRAIPSRRGGPGADARGHRDRAGAGAGARPAARRAGGGRERFRRRGRLSRSRSRRAATTCRPTGSGARVARLDGPGGDAIRRGGAPLAARPGESAGGTAGSRRTTPGSLATTRPGTPGRAANGRASSWPTTTPTCASTSAGCSPSGTTSPRSPTACRPWPPRNASRPTWSSPT